jgi:hypothetical protein
MAADTIYGRNLQEARRVFQCSLASFPVNSTETRYVAVFPSGLGKFRVTGAYWVSNAALSDADGVMTVAITARDVSEAADDALVSATTVEGGTAHVVNAFTLATEGTEKEFTLDEGDSIRVIFVNDSAAINTNGSISVFVVGHPVPNYDEKTSVQHPSVYSA